MLAVGGQVGEVAVLVVQGQALLGVAHRPGRRSLVEGGAGQQLMGVDGQLAVALGTWSTCSSSASETW